MARRIIPPIVRELRRAVDDQSTTDDPDNCQRDAFVHAERHRALSFTEECTRDGDGDDDDSLA